LVGDDVINRIGCRGARVDLDGAHRRAVDECLDAEVEVGRGAGDGGAKVVVGGADLDGGGVVAVNLDDGRSIGGVARGIGVGSVRSGVWVLDSADLKFLESVVWSDVAFAAGSVDVTGPFGLKRDQLLRIKRTTGDLQLWAY
jgi:hypothetical protein